jgi:hypothetical protein
VGYPTQKPVALLERIIQCASNEGDVVLDPFLGGGTTLVAADKLKRKWIGIDESPQAVKVAELRLQQQTDLFTDIYANSYTLQLHKYDRDALFTMNAYKFEQWIIGQYGGEPNTKQRGDGGVDGRSKDGVPIQVKQSEGVDVNVVKNFWSSIRQYDKFLFDKNKADGKPMGYIIAFSFGRGARKEAARLQNEEGCIIELVEVKDIVPLSTKPIITILNIKELERNPRLGIKTEITVSAKSDVEIGFYSYDFDYHEDDGFKATVIRDSTGTQIYYFMAGEYHIAIKAVDINGIESVEVIKLKVNGGVQWIAPLPQKGE